MKAPTELKLITAEQFGIDIEMAYATSKNFTGHPIYKSHDCYLHPLAAQGIKRASELLRPLNLKLKVWDAFRPITAQAELFLLFPDPDYVSDPESGLCSHCRGIAIDLTIIDHFGHELEMGTPFDDFRPLAHRGNKQISAEAQRNRLLLAGVMNLAGFDPLDTEWWHYQLPEAASYPIIKPEQKPSTLT